MNIEPVTSAMQIDTVVELADTIWREHYTPIIGIGQVDYMLKTFQSPEAIGQQIASERYRYFLLIDESIPIGYMSVLPRNSLLFVSKIYLLDSVRGKGLGKKAVDYLTGLAKVLGLKGLELTVNKYNPSIKAYEKMGFETIDDVVVDIGNGFVMDDYVMHKRIN